MFTGRSCETLNAISLNGKVLGEAEYESTLIPETTTQSNADDTTINATPDTDVTNATPDTYVTTSHDTTTDIDATNSNNVTSTYDTPNNNNITPNSDVTIQYAATSRPIPIMNISDSYGGPNIITNGLYEDNLTVLCDQGHYAKETKLDTFWAICQHNGTWSYDTCISELGLIAFKNILIHYQLHY